MRQHSYLHNAHWRMSLDVLLACILCLVGPNLPCCALGSLEKRACDCVAMSVMHGPTVPDQDAALFDALGLRSRPAFLDYASGNTSSRDFRAEVRGCGHSGGCGQQGCTAAQSCGRGNTDCNAHSCVEQIRGGRLCVGMSSPSALSAQMVTSPLIPADNTLAACTDHTQPTVQHLLQHKQGVCATPFGVPVSSGPLLAPSPNLAATVAATVAAAGHPCCRDSMGLFPPQ